MKMFIDPKSDKVDALVQYLINNVPIDKEILIVGIGTDLVIGDSFGCMSATLIQEVCTYIECRGTFNDLFHAKSIPTKVQELDTSKFIIALDAILSDNPFMLRIADISVKPSAGMGRNLPPIGDMSIAFGVECDVSQLFEKRYRLGDIYIACKFVAQAFKIYEEYITEKRGVI